MAKGIKNEKSESSRTFYKPETYAERNYRIRAEIGQKLKEIEELLREIV